MGVLRAALQVFFEHRAEQGDGVQRLAQVVAGGGKEAGFFLADALGHGHLPRQLFGQRLFLKAHEQRFGELAVLLAGKVQRGAQVHRATRGQKEVNRIGTPGQGRHQSHQHGYHKA